MMKICFKCGQELPLDQFYKHKQMADGYLNKCKTCTKDDVRNNRLKNLDYYRSYDRKRGNRLIKRYTAEYRKKYPNKYRATTMVNNAIRNGKLFSEPCSICGNVKSHAHHDDYLKPLNIRWLCAAHHCQWHAKHGEGLNSF